MTVLTFPSPEAPAFPGVACVVPDEWSVTTYPGALMAAVAPVVEGHFTPNVIVTVTRHSPGFDLKAAVEVLEHELASLPGAVVQEPAEGTAVSAARAVAFTDPTAGTLLQVHVVTVVDQTACVDVVHLVTSCGAGSIHTDEPLLDQVVSSLTISVSEA